jgi:hypothetical protein
VVSVMTFSDLTRPKIPLAVALSRLLEKVEAELANERLQASEKQQLRRRAELIRSLLRLEAIT